ncbi:hypothetical protein X802_01565 [Thermococcus guaymasensis DSM 11113]|uniref:Uncharacterized protein n=1 Tax=Thermococcus guaymasensis DSM 11113 TaxID=1432656 RepID=A0A0X1KMX1_9EURY|nr:hypothetical protein [Thermococcus guaymasensis]AJC72642.1 hypothetical protein X802_01565 [Thermococcus guaymasensis DSM 11113]
MTMLRKTLAFVVLFILALWGLQKASSGGYLSAFDASPDNLNLSVQSENNTVIVEWELQGGSIVRTLAGGRDAVILVYPGWVEDSEGSWLVLGDAENLSLALNGESPRNLTIIYHPFQVLASNGSAQAKLRVFVVPIDFPSTVQSGKIELKLVTYYGTCNNITLDVIYFHSTGKGDYRDLVLPLSVDFGKGFPILPGFRSRFNLTIGASEVPNFLSSAVNARYLGNWIDEPKGWLVVKKVNVTVCPPKTS